MAYVRDILRCYEKSIPMQWVGADLLQNCPAAIDVTHGLLLLNGDVWENYDDFQKVFIIEHELAHFRHPEYTEIEADREALHAVYGKVNQSLKRAIETLYQVGVTDEDRLFALYIEALKLDAASGNKAARKELEYIKTLPDDGSMGDLLSDFKSKNNMDQVLFKIGGFGVTITHLLLALILWQLIKK